MKKEEPLSEDQKFLMDLVAKDSVKEWSLAPDSSRIAKRVLLRKLIRSNTPENLNLIAEFYSVHFPSSSTKSKPGWYLANIPVKDDIEVVEIKVMKVEE